MPYLMVTPVASELYGKISELLQNTEVVALTAHPLEGLVDPYPNDDAEQKSMACHGLLSLLQKQLTTEAAEGWPLACMSKILTAELKPARSEQNGEDGDEEHNAENGDANGDIAMTDDSVAVTKHAFPAIQIPDSVNPGRQPLFPEIYYSVFADQDIESVPPTSNIASTIIRDAVIDTINSLDYNRTFVGKFIIDLDNCWAPNTFVKRATPFDKLRDIPEGKTTWKPEDVAIDAIFSQLLRIPAPVHRPVYYHSIIMEACKIAPSAIAPSLGRAIRFSYRTIQDLDLELVHRFTDWFAHHISNFEFRWKWTEWTSEVSLPELHPQKAFILAAIDKEIRLSFPKRISDSLPPDFATLISKAQYNDQPDFKYMAASVPYSQQGQALLTLLKDKSSDEEIQTVLDEVSSLAAGQGLDGDVAAADVFLTCICHIGSKSLSHILSSIEKNRNRLLSIGSTSEVARRQIITSVTEYWTYHPGQAINIVDKLLNYTILTPQSVIDWALADHLDSGRALSRHVIWELVWMTMRKVTSRVGEIAAARASPEIANNPDMVREITETLVRERDNMHDLMKQIEDVAVGVSAGVEDGMTENIDDGNADRTLLKVWGAKWTRVWRRRVVVENARSGDAAVEKLVAALALQEEVDGEFKADETEDRVRREEARAKREEERRARFEERRAAEEEQRGGRGEDDERNARGGDGDREFDVA